jgi:hypothetical protein
MSRWLQRLQRLQWGAGLALAAGTAALACASPSPQQSGVGQMLYVANAADDSITILDGQSGRRLGAPVRAGRAPGQLVAGPGGTLLHLSLANEHRGEVTWLHPTVPSGAAQTRWVAQALPLDPPSFRALAIAGSADLAAVAYLGPHGSHSPAGWSLWASRWHLALVDLASGTVLRAHTIAAPGELVISLALDAGQAGTVVYVALTGGGPQEVDEHRIVAVDALSGAALATRRLDAPPDQLMLAPGVDGLREWLYAVGPEDFAGDDFEDPL